MRVLATSNDPVRLSFLTALLADAGITAVVLDAQARQRVLDDARSPVFLEAQLRMRVKVASDRGEFVVPAAYVFVGFHQAAAVLSMRKRGSTA